MTSRHRITTRRSSLVAGALFLLLAIAVTACGSDTKTDDTKANDTDAVERSAATYRGTRACFTNNTSESIGIEAGDADYGFEYGVKRPESLDPISLGGTSWCRQIDGGNFDGGSLGFEVWLRRSYKILVLLKNNYLTSGAGFLKAADSCTFPPDPMEDEQPGSSIEAVCDGVKITVTFKRTSTYFQEWDVKFSQN